MSRPSPHLQLYNLGAENKATIPSKSLNMSLVYTGWLFLQYSELNSIYFSFQSSKSKNEKGHREVKRKKGWVLTVPPHDAITSPPPA